MQYDVTERKDLPHGHAAVGVDDNGIEHRIAGGVRDHRVFLLDGDAVAEVHDLDELADAGAIDGVTHEGRWYPPTTPRAWVEAWGAHVGWDHVDLAASIVDCVTETEVTDA